MIEAIVQRISRRRRVGKYRRMAARQRERWLARQARAAAWRAAFLAAHPTWERRCRQIELDNAVWCWRQAETEAARAAVMRELGQVLIPYWEAKQQAMQEAWVRQHAWEQAGRR